MNIPIPTTTQDIFSYGFNKGLYRNALYPETGIDSLDEISNLESNVIVGGVIRTVAQGGRLEITSENVRTIVFYDSEDEMESMIQSDSNPNFPGIDMTAVNNKEYLIDPSLENWATTTNLTYWTEDGVSGGTRDIEKESTEITSYFPPVSIYSAKLTATGNDGTDFGIYQDFSWGDDMATDYIFSCNYNIASRTAGKIKIEAYDQDNSISLGIAESTTTGSWEILRAKFSTSNTNITVRFKVYFENETDGVAYIDNISVKVMGSMIRLDNNWAYMATDKFEIYGKYADEAFQFLCDGLADTYSFNFSADNQADLGTSTYQFKNLYIDGIAYIDDIRLDIAQIGGATNYIDIAAGGILTMQGSATIDGVASGNLVDKSGNESISGTWSFQGLRVVQVVLDGAAVLVSTPVSGSYTANLVELSVKDATSTGNTCHLINEGSGHLLSFNQLGTGYDIYGTSNSWHIEKTGAITALSYGGITEANLVDKSAIESISGVWTYTAFPVTPSSAPTTNYQVANKKYIDDNSGSVSIQVNHTQSSQTGSGAAVDVTLKTITIAGGTMGTNGILRISAIVWGDITVGSQDFKLQFDGQVLISFDTSTDATPHLITAMIANRNDDAIQIIDVQVINLDTNAIVDFAYLTRTEDTSGDKPIYIKCAIFENGKNVYCERLTVETIV